MTSRRLLVVSGDYGVVQQVKQVLSGRNFSIHAAYSHLDAVYQLKYEQFELVLVDALMVNHKSGEKTVTTLAEMPKHPPLLVYAPSSGNGNGHWAGTGAEIVITSLENEPLSRGIARVLRMPLPTPDVARTVEQRPVKDDPESTSVFWRDEEMQTLFSLARSLAEVLDLSEVLNRVVEAARRLTNAEEGMILLPDGQSGQLYLRAKVGIDSDVADNFRIRTHDTIAGTVFEDGRPILLGESGPQKVKTEYFVNSLLYVPIIHKGQTLGVLGVNNKVKHDVFTERHTDLLVNLASYAAVGIENARVHGQSLRRAHELKALVDASQAINVSLAYDQTLPAICTQLTRVLNVGHAEIHAWDAKKKQLLLMARFQQANWREGHQPMFRLADRPTTQMAFDEHRHIYEQGEFEQERLRQAGVRALLVVPIFGGDQPLGALQAYYVRRPEAVPTHEVVSRVQRIMLEVLVGFSSSSDLINIACVVPGHEDLITSRIVAKQFWPVACWRAAKRLPALAQVWDKFITMLLEVVDQILRDWRCKGAVGRLRAVARIAHHADLIFDLHHNDRMLLAIDFAQMAHQRGERAGVGLPVGFANRRKDLGRLARTDSDAGKARIIALDPERDVARHAIFPTAKPEDNQPQVVLARLAKQAIDQREIELALGWLDQFPKDWCQNSIKLQRDQALPNRLHVGEAG